MGHLWKSEGTDRVQSNGEMMDCETLDKTLVSTMGKSASQDEELGEIVAATSKSLSDNSTVVARKPHLAFYSNSKHVRSEKEIPIHQVMARTLYHSSQAVLSDGDNDLAEDKNGYLKGLNLRMQVAQEHNVSRAVVGGTALNQYP